MTLLVVGAVVVGILVAAVAVMAFAGARLPVGHVAARRIHLTQPPEQVWQALTDVEAFPSWRSRVRRVEVLHSAAGRPRWREFGRAGKVTFDVVEAEPPRKLVARIADDSLPFGGAWTYHLDADTSGSTLTVTENGEVYNVLFRFMSRYLFGHTATIDAFLRDLGAKYGEHVAPRPAQTD